MNDELMIKLDNVYKKYRLGTIGGGTLRGDLQSWWARVRKKENPNAKIGSKIYAGNEEFYALNGISFEVKKGERVGIIGHNGAGKSTTLKLLSRVTAPTDGTIYLNGRVASMLEVGTGFHPELTGRENIYMNGAILGMKKAEIDKKMDEIIDFSECRQFIDTPVKRYSSGMFVKLAFSVAAHLDAEIMIMDEVLAVGDMAFQKKCIDKMNEVSKNSNRTILYVSHNMNTIRQLCDRCVVLDHGEVVFDGDVEEAIKIYLNHSTLKMAVDIDLTKKIAQSFSEKKAELLHICLKNKLEAKYSIGEEIRLVITSKINEPSKNYKYKITIINEREITTGSMFSDCLDYTDHGIYETELSLMLDTLTPGKYIVNLTMAETFGKNLEFVEHIVSAFDFEVVDDREIVDINWYYLWGPCRFKDVKIICSNKQ